MQFDLLTVADETIEGHRVRCLTLSLLGRRVFSKDSLEIHKLRLLDESGDYGVVGHPVAPRASAVASSRVEGPDDPSRARRLAWSDLLQRVWDQDVLQCPRCGGRMRLVALIRNPAVSEKILRHLGRWSRGPPRAPRLLRAD